MVSGKPLFGISDDERTDLRGRRWVSSSKIPSSRRDECS